MRLYLCTSVSVCLYVVLVKRTSVDIDVYVITLARDTRVPFAILKWLSLYFIMCGFIVVAKEAAFLFHATVDDDDYNNNVVYNTWPSTQIVSLLLQSALTIDLLSSMVLSLVLHCKCAFAVHVCLLLLMRNDMWN